jgi:hypothetical protein
MTTLALGVFSACQLSLAREVCNLPLHRAISSGSFWFEPSPGGMSIFQL